MPPPPPCHRICVAQRPPPCRHAPSWPNRTFGSGDDKAEEEDIFVDRLQAGREEDREVTEKPTYGWVFWATTGGGVLSEPLHQNE